MRYFQAEHERAYRTIAARGLSQWNDLFDDGAWTYEQFQNRPFLERALPQLDLPETPTAFEYGCGTGSAACFLAAQGFRVDAVDLIPEAIVIARRMTAERGQSVNFSVMDICAPDAEQLTRRYDIVLDSYCLQSIVTDEDRAALFAAVRARLKPGGHYLISTAIFCPERTYDPGTYDAATGVCYEAVADGSAVDGIVEIDGRLHAPHRRHLTSDALRAELTSAGFRVLGLDAQGIGADVVCRFGASPDNATPLDGSQPRDASF